MPKYPVTIDIPFHRLDVATPYEWAGRDLRSTNALSDTAGSKMTPDRRCQSTLPWAKLEGHCSGGKPATTKVGCGIEDDTLNGTTMDQLPV